MKKIIVLVAAAMMSAATWAQNLIFVDTNGNEIKSGSVLNMNEVEESWGDYQIALHGISIKNTGASDQNFSMTANVTALPAETSFQCCFGMNCRIQEKVGIMNLTDLSIGGNAMEAISNTEWMMGENVSEESCTVVFTITGGPSITVNFGKNLTGINEVQGSSSKVQGSMFNLNGQKVSKDYKGVKVMDGKKVM